MTARTFSAPGKAVICGEYAVLRGAPAVSMAVSRRAIVTTRRADGDDFVVTAPGYADGRWRFRLDRSARPSWLDDPPAGGLPLVEAVFAESGVAPAAPLAIDIDTRGFADARSGLKLGLGSSAAATVALTAALTAGQPARDLFPRAVAAHRRLQGGAGSGVDVATGCHGGVVSYRQDGGYPPVALRWPARLQYRFVYSGRPAATGDAIRRAQAVGECHWATLVDAALQAEQVLMQGEAGAMPAAIAAWADALRRFDAAGEIGIFAGGHAQMADLAADCGVAYKPCGAGGGDIGIALATEIADIETFCRRAGAAGFAPLDIRLDERGVTERTGDPG